MNTNCLLKILLLMLLSSLLFGCGGKTASKEDYSGYLKDYSKLEGTEDTKGERVLRYVSPRLTAQKYNKIIIEPVQFYPEPKPSEKVSDVTLERIKNYVNETLKREVGKNIEVVTDAGPATLRMRVALTAVGQDAEALKPYQFIPVALVLTGARAAAGAHPERAKIFFEAETSDSVSGERLAIAVRAGTGERLAKLKNEQDTVTLDTVKPLLDSWSEAYAEFMQQAVAKNK